MPKYKRTLFTSTMQKYLCVVVFIFLWIIIFLDNSWNLWNILSNWLVKILWEYYKFIFCPVLILLALFLIIRRNDKMDVTRWIGLLIYFVSLTTIIWSFKTDYKSPLNIYLLLEPQLWPVPTILLFVFLFGLSLVILFKFSPINLARKTLVDIPWKLKEIKNDFMWDWFRKEWKIGIREMKEFDKRKQTLKKEEEELRKKREEIAKSKQPTNLKLKIENWKENEDLPIRAKKIEITKKETWAVWWLFWWTNKNEETKVVKNSNFTNWEFPSLSLLDFPREIIMVDKNEIRKKELEIEEKLLQFKIEVSMEWYQVWPTVIQFRLRPKDWVKLQKIENLRKDLALALKAKSIRIQAPIPWTGFVWIEVPNPQRQAVYLKEVLSSQVFNNPKIRIPIAIWKDVSGNLIVWDLVKMPHLLVAGQTASWKSVWVNGFIISMLYKFSPSDLKLIMVDPKRVELSVYNWIPHLLTPVLTNSDKALNALKWCVAEMLRRYDLSTKVKARNLEEYNDKVDKSEKLPYIVMVIDELADLMMSWNKKEVEASIVRIAQMARAVWMHLIVATQRPSVDVITWLIKANIPSRIAFTVASQIDSRTVIDKIWAEDLLGRWDMLYSPTWVIEPERVQWVLVETHEVEAIVNKLKLTVDPDMLKNLQISEISEWKSKTEGSILEWYSGEQEENPEIIEKAIELLRKEKKGSTSLIQRKLWLWYARAAKILDILEELWVVWPANWSKPREVYVD